LVREFRRVRSGALFAEAPPVPPPPLTSIQLAGQHVVFAFGGTGVPANLRKRIARGEAAGVLLFGANVQSIGQVRSLTRELQAIRRPKGLTMPLVVMTDQEGGLVKRLPGAPALNPPRMSSNAVARDQGRATAGTLSSAGVNVDLAPVADVARPGSQMEDEGRSFGRSTATVGRRARAFAAGLRAGGIASTAKHFPGFGAASANTDAAAVVIRTPLPTLRARDEPPFSVARTDLVMTSSAIYPALSDQPALLSRRIVTGELRGRLGFRGVVVTDSLNATALVGRHNVLPRALKAGNDLLLFTTYESSAHAVERLADLYRSGRLDRSAGMASAQRVLALRHTLRK
jgi:beta-N-acetylhexosaminidase